MKNILLTITGNIIKYKNIILLYIGLTSIFGVLFYTMDSQMFKADLIIVNTLTTNIIDSPSNSCNVLVNKRYYVGENKAFIDTFSGVAGKEYLFRQLSSNVDFYNNGGFSVVPTFNMNSAIKPSVDDNGNAVGDIRLLTSNNGYTMKQPNGTADEMAAQIVYNIKWEESTNLTGPAESYDYAIGNTGKVRNYTNKPIWNDTNVTTHKECINIYISWCGDGRKDDGTINGPEGESANGGEECDPNDTSKSGWGNGGCSTTCTALTLAPSCGNGILDAGEECDDGNTNDGDMCNSSCVLETPTCTLTATPDSGINPFTATFTATSNGNYTNIDFGNGNSQINPDFTNLTHEYTSAGTYTPSLTVKNNYSGATNGTILPTYECTTTITSMVPLATCGNGILDAGEECDDGNTNDGDTCSATCVNSVIGTCGLANGNSYGDSTAVEAGGLCLVGTSVWIDNTANDGEFNWDCLGNNGGVNTSCAASLNQIPATKICGDGNIDTPNDAGINETCDDGNNVDGDGCSANCQTEVPINGVCGISDGKTFSSKPNVNLCGNSSIPVVNGDGPWTWICTGINGGSNSNICSANKSTITEEFHSTAGGASGERRRRALCGNGIVDFELEECDDGNNMGGDGCSARCHIEKVCGDGNIDAININGQREECDDGNLINGDGCSSTCKIDDIIKPFIFKPKFKQVCGNGIREQGEDCDDGNMNNFDLCTNACMFSNIAIKPKFSETKSEIAHTGPSEIIYFLSVLLSGGIFFRRRLKKLISE